MDFRKYIDKLRSFDDQKKKAIVWSVVVILIIILGVFWFQKTINRLDKLGGVVKDIKLPELNMTGQTSLTK